MHTNKCKNISKNECGYRDGHAKKKGNKGEKGHMPSCPAYHSHLQDNAIGVAQNTTQMQT